MIEEPPRLSLYTNTPRPTQAQIDAFAGVETAHICDALGGIAAMSTDIGPLGFGRDLPVFAAGPALVCDSGPGDIVATLAAVEHLTPGDIVVHVGHGFQGCAVAGDQVCGMLRNAGAAALVSDGPVRDYDGIVGTGLPVWCTGLNSNSPATTGPGVMGTSAVVGGRPVATGDMIVADINGVAVVPFAMIDAVIAKVAEVRQMEEELAARVKTGFRAPLDTAAMLADGRAKQLD